MDPALLIAKSAFADTADLRAVDIASGTVSAAEAAAQLTRALELHEAQVQAFMHVDAEAVRERAAALDRAATRGALQGVPVALKDNIDTSDMPSAYGSAIHAGHQPRRDAACAAMLRLAGANIAGKTITTEFAHRHPGATRNPWHTEHTPGGSSSGSAAAVASAMVPLALGTQTTGSVIRPAAYCGVMGYKPSYGDINVAGVLPNTPSFDTVGLMARCIADLQLARRAFLDDSVSALPAPALSQLRIGVCHTPFWGRVDNDMRALLEASAAALSAAGAAVTDFDEAGAFDGVDEASRIVSGYEFARTLSHERLHAPDALSNVLRDGRMADGLRERHADYVASQRLLATARARLDEAFGQADVLLTPAAPGCAPRGLGHTGSADLNMLWTSLHTPALTLPIAQAANGLPLGLQMVARRYDDDRLLAAGAAVFAALRR